MPGAVPPAKVLDLVLPDPVDHGLACHRREHQRADFRGGEVSRLYSFFERSHGFNLYHDFGNCKGYKRRLMASSMENVEVPANLLKAPELASTLSENVPNGK